MSASVQKVTEVNPKELFLKTFSTAAENGDLLQLRVLPKIFAEQNRDWSLTVTDVVAQLIKADAKPHTSLRIQTAIFNALNIMEAKSEDMGQYIAHIINLGHFDDALSLMQESRDYGADEHVLNALINRTEGPVGALWDQYFQDGHELNNGSIVELLCQAADAEKTEYVANVMRPFLKKEGMDSFYSSVFETPDFFCKIRIDYDTGIKNVVEQFIDDGAIDIGYDDHVLIQKHALYISVSCPVWADREVNTDGLFDTLLERYGNNIEGEAEFNAGDILNTLDEHITSGRARSSYGGSEAREMYYAHRHAVHAERFTKFRDKLIKDYPQFREASEMMKQKELEARQQQNRDYNALQQANLNRLPKEVRGAYTP